MNKKYATTFLSAALVFFAGVTGGANAADIQLQLADDTAILAADASTKSRVYIVMMKDDPAVAYEGDISGYKATKPAAGKKINPKSAGVKKYTNYLDSTHDGALSSVGAGDKIYSYHYALNGFAAVLSAAQIDALRARDDVVRVWQDEIRRPTTDSTPDYLGLTGAGGVWANKGKGEDIIVGIIDTGIWPEHESFSDQKGFADANGSSGKRNLAYGPPPAGWSGICESGERWSQDNCNNKLIGARFYPDGFSAHGHSEILMSDFLSPRDSDGHGSHTASTAAGNEGPLNTINGLPVSGIAPRARIAAYKVCWEPRAGDGGCASSDSAAAIDQAVADGVDVINFSIGGGSTVFAGADDIAFLFAASAGVWVATSNGNAGPLPQTTGTPAGVPWITAVGAAQDDEVFSLSLGVAGDLNASYFALEGAGPVAFTGITTGDMVPAVPLDGCAALTNGADVAGEIALVIRGTCSFSAKYNNAAAAGASAIIVYNDGTDAGRIDPIVMSAPGTTIPGAMIGFFDGGAINSAVSGGGSVNGSVDSAALVLRDNRIAGFSSRGPNGGAPDVIKPDVAAPGVSIIAAETLEPNANAGGGVPYQRISGTSMASPHVAGAFALLKEAHPDWSPAMAKSALMTSARQDLMKTARDEAADPFDIGAGAIVPAGAFEPGLVYDAGLFEYAAFSCGNNFQIFNDASCNFLAGIGLSFDGSDLNLASIGVADLVGSQTVTRQVTSVTAGTTTFTASHVAPAGIDVVISPGALVLNEGVTATYTVTLSANTGAVPGEWAFGSLTWDNDAGVSAARSPIAVKPVQLDAPAEASGSGTDSMLSFDIGFGYAGDYTADASGLVPAVREVGNVLDDPGNSFAFFGPGTTLHLAEVPPGTEVARWALFNEFTDGNDDLDLYVFHCPGGLCTQVGLSGNGDSNESVTLISPTPALLADGDVYLIFVHGWQTDGPDANYTLFNWASGAGEGNMTVSGPLSATLGATETITVNWVGLDAGEKYLGAVVHGDGTDTIGHTVISISTE